MTDDESVRAAFQAVVTVNLICSFNVLRLRCRLDGAIRTAPR